MQCDRVGNPSSPAHCKPGGVWACSVVQQPLTGLRMGASLHCPAWPFPFCETLVVVVVGGGSFTFQSLHI